MPDMSAKEIAQAIGRSAETQAAVLAIANEIAAEATQVANMTVGKLHADKKQGGKPIPAVFGTNVRVGTDTARAHVWAQNGPAIHAERKDGILVEIANQHGKPGKRKGRKK